MSKMGLKRKCLFPLAFDEWNVKKFCFPESFHTREFPRMRLNIFIFANICSCRTHIFAWTYEKTNILENALHGSYCSNIELGGLTKVFSMSVLHVCACIEGRGRWQDFRLNNAHTQNNWKFRLWQTMERYLVWKLRSEALKLWMMVFAYIPLSIYFMVDNIYCDAGTVTIAKLWTGLPCTTSTRTRRSLQRPWRIHLRWLHFILCTRTASVSALRRGCGPFLLSI